MHTFEAYDCRTDASAIVPATTMSHQAFCQLARDAWTLLRAGLGRPIAEPRFTYNIEPTHRCDFVGTVRTLRCGEPPVVLDTQRFALILPGDDVFNKLRVLTAEVAFDRPIAFGRLLVPQTMWAARLTCEADDFSLRAVHACDRQEKDGQWEWLTRLDVLLASGR
jgi:hypothetical protein